MDSRVKVKPRQTLIVQANLERFPWGDPRVRAGICRVLDIALAKIIAEDKKSNVPEAKEETMPSRK